MKMEPKVEDKKVGREVNVGKDEVHSKGELDNPNIKMIEKKRNIVVRMTDVTSVGGKAILHKIAKPRK